METILFLCPHNAAKGILAEAYFNFRVKQMGLLFQADSAGTDPDTQLSPSVVALLEREGIPLTTQIPRRVRHEDLLHAFQVISMGCAQEEVEGALRPFTFWNDIPPVSADLEGSSLAIRHRVDQLVAELANATEKSRVEEATGSDGARKDHSS